MNEIWAHRPEHYCKHCDEDVWAMQDGSWQGVDGESACEVGGGQHEVFCCGDAGKVNDDDSGTTYTPWTNGHAVGFRAERGGKVEYIYLNPSGGSDDGVANVFLYQVTDGEPSGQDSPAAFFDLFDSEAGNPARPGSLEV